MTIDQPKVSVILPYFNAEQTLERAVRSVLNQTFSNFELILVNNISTDDSTNIAWLLEGEDKRIKLSSEHRKGVSHAANNGNRIAKGEYIARMDADDLWYATKLEKQVELLDNNPQIGVASCLVNHISHNENTEGLKKYVDWVNSIKSSDEIYLNRFIESPIINPTVLYRRELLEWYGGYIQGDFPEDYDMWLRWLDMGVKMEKVPEILFNWYDSDNRLTRTDERYSTNAFYQIKAEHLSKWLHNNDHPYIWVWGAGRKSRKRVSLLEKKGIYVEGYIDVKERKLENMDSVNYHDFNWEAPSFILSYVPNWGARDKIREFMISKRKIEGIDFILVA